jgi:flagellar motility protein MotE (MotC chaperone)
MDNKQIERIKNNTNIINNEPEKKKRNVRIPLIISAVIILTAALILMLDVGMYKTKLTAIMKGEDTEILKKSPEQIRLDSERYELYLMREELLEKEEKINLLEESLNKRVAALKKEEEDLSQKEEELKVLQDELSSRLISYKEIVGMYEKMEPAIAARLMQEMQNKELTIYILKNVKSDLAANILSLMEPKEAAFIIEEMTLLQEGGEKKDERVND